VRILPAITTAAIIETAEPAMMTLIVEMHFSSNEAPVWKKLIIIVIIDLVVVALLNMVSNLAKAVA
jgi:hypothetical protein